MSAAPLPEPGSSSGPFVPLAEGFAPADRAAWEALVQRTLKGADPSTLQRRTADGLTIKPLYDRADAPAASSPGRTVALDVRVAIGLGAEAAERVREALEGGATSLLLDARNGGAGLAQALEGVILEAAGAALDAGFDGPAAARALGQVAKASPAARLAFHLDPLSAFAEAGTSPQPMDRCIQDAIAAAADLAPVYPGASLFLASGGVVNEAGGTAAQELAFCLASAVAYLKGLTGAGMSPEEALGRIALGLAVEAEPLAAIPKLRAARRLFERIASACGAQAPARIEARASRRMLTRTEPWTNLIRLTTAGFAAAAGGADALILAPFDDAGSELARRQALNIALVLTEESGLSGRPDPAAGAYAIEALTDELARAAWTRFQEIERAGGALEALTSGALARDVAAAREALMSEIAHKRRRILGVTDFRAADAPPAPPPPRASAGALAAIRLEDLA